MKRHPRRSLAVERCTLAHPEAVLLVDHAQRQLAKLHGRLDQRVRAHHELQLPTGEPAKDLAAARGGCGPREQGDRHEPAKQAVERGEVLLGQRLGGSHQRGLAAVLGRAQHRVERHHGLARAHLTHEQPLHRPAGGEVLVDRGERGALVVRGLERETGEPGLDELSGRVQHGCALALAPGPPPRPERELRHQQLLERQAAASELRLLGVLGEVDGLQCGRPLRQALGRAQAPRQRLHGVAH